MQHKLSGTATYVSTNKSSTKLALTSEFSEASTDGCKVTLQKENNDSRARLFTPLGAFKKQKK